MVGIISPRNGVPGEVLVLVSYELLIRFGDLTSHHLGVTVSVNEDRERIVAGGIQISIISKVVLPGKLELSATTPVFGILDHGIGAQIPSGVAEGLADVEQQEIRFVHVCPSTCVRERSIILDNLISPTPAF